jgi:hypothetical protein
VEKHAEMFSFCGSPLSEKIRTCHDEMEIFDGVTLD